MRLDVNIVDADNPLLIGLDVLDKARAFVDNVENNLRFKDNHMSLTLVRKLGHIYLTWDSPAALFSRTELRKMYLHFSTLLQGNFSLLSPAPTPIMPPRRLKS